MLTSRYSPSVKLQVLEKNRSINNGALFENFAAQELAAHGEELYYFNSKKQGELDFVIELDGKVCPIEIKSGKDYKRHRALENVLKDANYEIGKGVYLFRSEHTAGWSKMLSADLSSDVCGGDETFGCCV